MLKNLEQKNYRTSMRHHQTIRVRVGWQSIQLPTMTYLCVAEDTNFIDGKSTTHSVANFINCHQGYCHPSELSPHVTWNANLYLSAKCVVFKQFNPQKCI